MYNKYKLNVMAMSPHFSEDMETIYEKCICFFRK